jgi:ATP-dependent Lhr-like helicase
LAAYVSRGARQIQVMMPEDEPARTTTARAIAGRLAALARDAGLLIAEIDGVPTAGHPLSPFLTDAGFHPSSLGFMVRRSPTAHIPAAPPPARSERPRAADDLGGEMILDEDALPRRTSNPFARPRGRRA